MSSRQEGWLQHLVPQRRATASGNLSDEQLLRRFVAERDESAFEALLIRHGPMVLGVCRRLLRDPAAAQDAFQATFLVLLQKAGSLRQGGMLASWLHGVARRTALRARVEAAKRKARESQAAAREPADPLAEISVRELLDTLDEELQHLSARYRAPLIACYLEGKTRDTAARELGLSVATLGRRLERGRHLLGSRLARHGLSLPSALLATLLPSATAPAAVPNGLTAATLQTAQRVAAGEPVVAAASAQVATLSEGVVRAMFMTRLKMSVVLLLVALLASSAGLLAYQAAAAVQPPGITPRPADASKVDGPPQVRRVAMPPRQEVPADAIKHWAVAEVPLPRDRNEFGIGEKVDFWVDGKVWKPSSGAIVWHIRGAGTVFPVVGMNSRMKVDLADRDGQLSMVAFHQPDEPPQAQIDENLARWLQEHKRDMLKRAHHPVVKVRPEEKLYRPELRAVLNKLDGYRTGSKASLIEMDRLAAKLAKGFHAAGERGQVYYQIAHVHSQSGLHFPEKVQEYCRKALALPLAPEQRFRLYVYWGDSQWVDKRSMPAAEKRRLAAVRYLEGLKRLLPYQLPQKAPELPAINKLGAYRPSGDPADPRFIQQMQIYLREKDRHDKAWAARLQAEYIGKLVWEREVLAGQIVSLYHKDRASWSEIREMATAVLGDRSAVEQLLGTVKSGKAWYSK